MAVLSVLVGAGAALVLRSALTAPSGLEQQVAALEQAELTRDADLARDLVASATTAHGEVLAVVSAAEAAAADGGTPATPQQLTDWTNEVVGAGAPFQQELSGGTRVNLTRAGFAHATDLLEQSLRTQRDAADAPAAQQAQLDAAADELFRSALVGWSIAATELDDLAVAHDLGHVHLYLTDDPGTGAITSHEGHEEEGVQP